MAYVIQCHIVDPETNTIPVVVSFYGADEEEATERYDKWFEKKIELSKLAEAGDVLEEEAEIDDSELPEVEEEVEAPPQG